MSIRRPALPIVAASLAIAVAIGVPATAATPKAKAKVKVKVKAKTTTTVQAAKGPITIAYLGIESGPNATANRHNTIDLAVEKINAAGGMDGHQVVVHTYDAGQTPDLAVTAMTKAVSDNPDIVMGLPVTAQVMAVAQLVKDSGLPLVHSAQSPDVGLAKLGLENGYRMNVAADTQVAADSKYISEVLKPKKVGLLYSTDTNSHNSGVLLESQLKAKGIDVISREVSSTATDVTEAVLAFKGVDVTASWTFPAVNSLFIKQKSQNGITVPHIMDTGGGSILSLGLNSPDELKNINYVSACDGDLVRNAKADEYRGWYKDKYGKLDSGSSNPTNYDTLWFIKAAVEKAGSLDHKAVSAALGQVSVNNVCGVEKTNANHDLMTTMYIVHSDGGAANKSIVQTYPQL